MSISGQNLSVVIVTLKSEKIIHQCIKSIDNSIPIVVVENSNDQEFKDHLELTYKNVKCVLSKSNIGMGAANNIGIKLTKTDYVLVLNPDVILDANTLKELYLSSNKLKDFSIISPISSNKQFPNYGMSNKKRKIQFSDKPFLVDYVDGFAMLLNKRKFSNGFYFDDKIFLYLENDDLCLRVTRNGGSIYVIPQAKVIHAGAKTVDLKYQNEVELSRNWHWMWSKFYFNKKNFGFLKAIKECLIAYISAIIKFLFYLLIKNDFKKKIYYNRASGFYNSLMGKPSWYRPNLND